MKASELACLLSDLIVAHGDLEVGINDSEFKYYGHIDEVKIHEVRAIDERLLGKLCIGIVGR